MEQQTTTRKPRKSRAKPAPAPAEFKPMPGSGWAFATGTVGPEDDRQVLVNGRLPMNNDKTLFAELRIPQNGGTAFLTLKEIPNEGMATPTEGEGRQPWPLVAQCEVPAAARPNAPRRVTFKFEGRNYRLDIVNGMTAGGRKCLRLRVPDLLPMPLV